MLIEAQGRGGQRYSFAKATFGARWEWVASATPRSTPPSEIAAVRFVQEVGWVPGPVWMGMEKKKSFFYTKFRTLTMKPVPTTF